MHPTVVGTTEDPLLQVGQPPWVQPRRAGVEAHPETPGRQRRGHPKFLIGLWMRPGKGSHQGEAPGWIQYPHKKGGSPHGLCEPVTQIPWTVAATARPADTKVLPANQPGSLATGLATTTRGTMPRPGTSVPKRALPKTDGISEGGLFPESQANSPHENQSPEATERQKTPDKGGMSRANRRIPQEKTHRTGPRGNPGSGQPATGQTAG